MTSVAALAEYIRQQHPTAIISVTQVNAAVEAGGPNRPIKLEAIIGPVDSITFDAKTGYVHLR